MRVSVPASSANLGAGFDVLGMALTIPAELGIVDGDVPDKAEIARGAHPAATAFSSAGGRGQVWVRTSIPSGRGLGFSGAVRVGAIALALQQSSSDDVLVTRRHEIFERAAVLEGHGDNVAASTYGGVVVVADGSVGRVPVAVDPAMVVWVPSFKTNTSESRSTLSSSVSRVDAVFNIGRSSLFVAALASGDVGLLREATRDRLHQDARLATATASRDALDAALSTPAWAAWLSGSGPTVAVMCDRADAERVSAAWPNGRSMIVSIDQVGAHWL